MPNELHAESFGFELSADPYLIGNAAFLFWLRIGIDVQRARVRTFADWYLNGWSAFGAATETGSQEDAIHRKWNIPPRALMH